MSLSCLTGVYYLLLCGVFVTPAEVINNCAREKYIFLKHHTYGFTKLKKLVFFYVFAADENLAAGHVVKSRNKAYERCLCASRTAYNAYGFAGIYFKARPVYNILFAVRAVLKADIFKLYGAILNLEVRLSVIVVYVGLFLNDLGYTCCGGSRHNILYQYHGYHYDRHKYHHNIGRKRAEFAYFHFAPQNEL